jgi:hypothetical protein
MKETANTTSCPSYTLSEAVDEYLLTRGIDKKKYYLKYLVIAQRIWQELFWNTLWVVSNVKLPLKKGHPYHYVDFPGDCERLLSVTTTDHCGKMVPLYYNHQLDVLPDPPLKQCGCGKCDCGGVCADVNAFTVTTTLLFTINGIGYSEKTWLKYCPNGDLWEYREVPTKKYLDFVGETGDYNNDYNTDYSTGSSLGNFTIVTETFQKKICTLEVKPCGCPVETPANQTLLMDHCGCFLTFSHTRRCHCDPFLNDPGPDVYGEIKVSSCRTRIYYRPNMQRHLRNCIVSAIPAALVTPDCPGAAVLPALPTFLQVIYQTNSKTPNTQTLVPDYSLGAMFSGMDWKSKLFNSKYSLQEKQFAKYQYNDDVNKIIAFLNPFNLETLSHIQDAPMRW